MNKDIKTVRNFKAAPDIDEVIESWANNSGFKESVLSGATRAMMMWHIVSVSMMTIQKRFLL